MPTKDMENEFIKRMANNLYKCTCGDMNTLIQRQEETKARVETLKKITPVCIKRRGTASIVQWADGTQTKIVRPADEADAGLYATFCIALAKKLYGSNSALKKAIHFADEERQLAAVQQIAETKKLSHEERMRKQLARSTKRIARLARRAFKRDVIAQLATENIQVEAESEENEPC